MAWSPFTLLVVPVIPVVSQIILWKCAVHSVAFPSMGPPAPDHGELSSLPLLSFCLCRVEKVSNQVLPSCNLNVLLVESNFSEVLFVGIFYRLSKFLGSECFAVRFPTLFNIG